MSKQVEATVPFRNLNFLQKCLFIGKAIISVMSFGFLFSHIFTEF